MTTNSSHELVQLLKTRFSNLNIICKNIENLVNDTHYSKNGLKSQLSNLKNELRLVEVAIPSFKITSVLNGLSITPSELYILIFRNVEQFLKKALKGDKTAIIECISAIRASISLWETRVFHIYNVQDSKATISVEQPRNPSGTGQFEWDVFISHATEDKENFVRELANRLEQNGLKVWYDEFTLKVGDRLRESIEKGLSTSQYGIVVLSHAFFKKDWPQRELSVLLERDSRNRKVILPIWLDLNVDDVKKYFPLMADMIACKAEDGMDKVVDDLMAVLRP